MRKIISLLLIAVILFSISAPPVFADTYAVPDGDYTPRDMKYATREEAIAGFVKAIGLDTPTNVAEILKTFSDSGKIASAYRREIAAAISKDMVFGYADGTFRPQEYITRVEALVILNRILSSRTLPSVDQRSFDDTPEWAEAEITRLSSAGIIKGYGDGRFGASDLLTLEQVSILSDRASRLMGPAGDFYEYANEDWLNKTELPAGQSYWSSAHEISQQLMKQVGDIVYTLYRQRNRQEVEFTDGSSEQKIADMFSVAGNIVYRDSLGIEPVKEYLKMIDGTKNINELLDVMAYLEYSGFHGLLPISISVDAYNSDKYILTFSEVYTGLSVPHIQGTETQRIIEAYSTYLEKLFTLYGYDKPKTRAEKTSQLCKTLANSSMALSKHNQVEENYNVYTINALEKVFTNIDINRFIKKLGFNKAETMLVYDLALAQKVNSLFTPDNFTIIKDYLRASVMDGSSMYLNSDSFYIWRSFQDNLNGFESGVMPGDYAINIVQELLGWDIAKLYVEKYASETDKLEVEKLTRQILAAYIEQIQANTWLSESSKNSALKKLNNLIIKVGYPDNISEYPDLKFKIQGQKDGGNLIQYRTDYCQRYFDMAAEIMNSDDKIDKNNWSMLPHTVNAMYDVASNSITIPAGILQPPFYSSKASYEENLGGIGAVIAHEISHALDSLGSRFDENGNLKDWWQKEDKKAFEIICNKVVAEYNKVEIADGLFINGEQTLGENLADIAGMSCVLQIARNNYLELDKLFCAYASIWRMKTTDEYTKTLLQADTHSPDKARVNRVLSNFAMFSEFYGIQQGDGMYLPADRRIRIWNK